MKPRNRLLVMSGGHLLNDGVANYLPGVLPAVLLSLGASKGQAGVLMGFLVLGQGLQPVIGWISDRVGGKAITLGGLCVSTVAGAMIGLAPNYGVMITLLMIMGVANACFHPQALAGVRQLAAARRGLSTATFLIGGEFGRGVWPFLAGLVVVSFGLPYLWLLALPTLFFLPLLIVSFPTLEPKPSTAASIAWRKHIGPMTRVVVFTALRTIVIYALVTFLALWWQEQGGSDVGGAAMVMVLYTVGIIGSGAGGHLADRLGFVRIAAAASIASVILMVLFLVVTGPAIWLVVSLLGIALFSTFPISIALGQDVLPENPSMGAGMALGFCNALAAMVILGLGLLVPRIGITGVLWISTGISVLAVVAAFFLPEHSPHEPVVVESAASSRRIP